MTLRIEPLESCMNVLNVLFVYCLFNILSRGLTVI